MDNSLIKDETNAMGWTFNETIDNNLLFTYSSLGCGSETVQFQIPLLDLVSQVEYLTLDVYKREIELVQCAECFCCRENYSCVSVQHALRCEFNSRPTVTHYNNICMFITL